MTDFWPKDIWALILFIVGVCQNHSFLSGLSAKPWKLNKCTGRERFWSIPGLSPPFESWLRSITVNGYMGTKLVGWKLYTSATAWSQWTSPVARYPCTPWAGSHLHPLPQGGPNAEIGSLLVGSFTCFAANLQWNTGEIQWWVASVVRNGLQNPEKASAGLSMSHNNSRTSHALWSVYLWDDTIIISARPCASHIMANLND